jgi:hypothetical protein
MGFAMRSKAIALTVLSSLIRKACDGEALPLTVIALTVQLDNGALLEINN